MQYQPNSPDFVTFCDKLNLSTREKRMLLRVANKFKINLDSAYTHPEYHNRLIGNIPSSIAADYTTWKRYKKARYKANKLGMPVNEYIELRDQRRREQELV